MSRLLLDGYSLDFVIPARGPWPALKARYRPALYQRLAEYRAAIRDADAAKTVTEMAKFVKGQMVSWDVAGASGLMPCTEENIAKLPAPYIDELVAAVSGYMVQEQVSDAKNLDTASA